MEDDLAQFEALSGVCVEHDAVLPMLVDVNMGMNRTGVPIERLEELYRSSTSGASFVCAECTATTETTIIRTQL